MIYGGCVSAKVVWVSLLLVAISVPAAAKSCRDAVLDTNGNGYTYTCTRTDTDIVPNVQDMTVTTSPFPFWRHYEIPLGALWRELGLRSQLPARGNRG